MKNKQYFIYVHIRVDNSKIFYVGRGTLRDRSTEKSIYSRAYQKINRNNYWHNIVKKSEYKVAILEVSDNFDYIVQREKDLIKKYGRIIDGEGCLVNMSKGGNDIYGPRFYSKETRLKMSEKAKLRVGILNPFYGKKHNYETRMKMGTSVVQMDKEGNVIEEFPTMTLAATKTGSDFRLIYKICQKEVGRHTHNGFKWKYKTSQRV